MSFSNWSTEKISKHHKLSDDEYQKTKYGFDILYINLSKTTILLLLTIILGITKETLLLLGAFTCVRSAGFGYHSNNTIKCTVLGVVEFIGFTYVAILFPPFSILVSSVICFVCIIIFSLYAPVETAKRPISNSRKGYFKIMTLIISICLFSISIYIGKNLYRNLIVMGISLEAVSILPLMKRLIL